MLGGHAAKLFGDIKTPESKDNKNAKLKVKRDEDGKKVKIEGHKVRIVPEGQRAIRSLPADRSSYEPDHMFGLGNPIGLEFVSEDNHIQTNFVDLFHDAVWGRVEEHDALNPDDPILPTITPEFAEAYNHLNRL